MSVLSFARNFSGCALFSVGVFASVCAYAQKTDEFAVRAQVAPPPGASLVRVALPAASIAALRESNGADLRVFNAKGVSIPHAVIDAANQVLLPSETTRERFVALPIFAAESIAVSTPTLRIEEGPNRRVIEVPLQSAKTAQREERKARGVLFDTRKLSREISGVELEGTLPASTIVRVSIDASNDLKSWQTFASETPVFEFANDGPSNKRISFPSRKKIEGQYLRISWSTEFSPNISALKVIEPVVATNVGATPVRIELGAPTNVADTHAEWSIASSYRVQAVHLSTDANNALMPVQILTRARPGDAWRSVASTVVYRMSSSSGTNVNPSVRVDMPPGSQWRVEPASGYSIKSVPLRLAFEYAPLQLVFLASGEGPFEIATGRGNTQSAALPIRTLIPDYKQGAEFELPLVVANVASSTANATALAVKNESSTLFTRSNVLWGVLGLAVLVLSAIALSLLRSTPANKESGTGEGR